MSCINSCASGIDQMRCSNTTLLRSIFEAVMWPSSESGRRTMWKCCRIFGFYSLSRQFISNAL